MATTGTLVEWLAAGVKTTTGTPLASGKISFYQPGTLTPQTVYSDSACTSAISQPVVLSSGGVAVVYANTSIRMIVKDATNISTLFDVTENVQRDDNTFVTSPSFNGGGETTLSAILDLWQTTGGGASSVAWGYKQSGTATERTLKTWLAEVHVSVKDFGAVGDGSSNDTSAVQAAITAVGAAGGGIVYFPPGTYLINAALTMGTSGVSLVGAGPSVSVIKQSSGSTNTLTITSASDVTIQGVGISHSTTSTGFGISLVNCSNTTIRNVSIASHARLVSITGTSTKTRIVDSALTLPSGATNIGVYYSAGNYHSIAGTSILPTSGGKLISFDGTTSYASVDSCIFSSTANGGLVFEATLSGLYFTIANNPSLSQFAANQAFICNLATIPVVTQSGNGIEFQQSTNDITSGATYTPNLFCSYSSVFANGITTGSAYTVAAPNPALHIKQAGKIVTMIFENSAGAPITGWTFNAIYRISGAVSLVDGQRTAIIFLWDGAALREIGRGVFT